MMGPAFAAAFTGTAIEFFETLVIAYAIVRAGYAREAWSAVVLGHALVFGFAWLLFPLRDVLPLQWLRLGAALLLTAMGLHWTQKSLRRLIKGRRPRWAEDPLAKLDIRPAAAAAPFSWWVFLVMAKSSLVEAGEILIVVFPIAAATTAWWAVGAGVAAGIGAVCLLALLLHRQLKQVPEVKLKLAVGLLLSALGLSWLVELSMEGGLPVLPWNA